MAARRTIGVLSRETGVKVTTIRYYESIGLLEPPDRTESGQRVYGGEAVERLSFIRHARELGFPVEAIRELIDLQTRPGEDCAMADRVARRHLAEVRRRISRLAALEAELRRMIVSCEGGRICDCAVMASLADHSACMEEVHAPPEIALGASPGRARGRT